MVKLLVIVELLVKVKMINKYFGKNFIVKSLVGYVWDFLMKVLGKVEFKKLVKEFKILSEEEC